MRCKFALGWIHVVVKSLKVDNVWRFGDSDSKWKWKCVERREASACGFSLHGQFAKLWLGTLGSCWCRLGLRVKSRVTAWLVCGDTTKLDTIVVCVWQFSHSAVCSICIHVLDTFLFEPWVEWKFCGQCSVRSDWLDFVVHAKSSQPDSREFYFFVRRCSSVREVWFEKGVGYSRAPQVCLRDKGLTSSKREFVLDTDCSLALSQWVLASRCRQNYVLCQHWGFYASSLLDGSRLFGELIVVLIYLFYFARTSDRVVRFVVLEGLLSGSWLEGSEPPL